MEIPTTRKAQLYYFLVQDLSFCELFETSFFYPRFYDILTGNFIHKALSICIYMRDCNKVEFKKDLENAYQRQQVIITKNEKQF